MKTKPRTGRLMGTFFIFEPKKPQLKASRNQPIRHTVQPGVRLEQIGQQWRLTHPFDTMGPPGKHTTARELQTCTFEVPAFKRARSTSAKYDFGQRYFSTSANLDFGQFDFSQFEFFLKNKLSEGWSPEGCGPKMSRFFPSPATIFFSFFPLLGGFSWNFGGVFEGRHSISANVDFGQFDFGQLADVELADVECPHKIVH